MEHVRTPKGQLHEIPIEFLASFSFTPFGHYSTVALDLTGAGLCSLCWWRQPVWRNFCKSRRKIKVSSIRLPIQSRQSWFM